MVLVFSFTFLKGVVETFQAKGEAKDLEFLGNFIKFLEMGEERGVVTRVDHNTLISAGRDGQ